jgi:hypothetical protein
MRLGLICVIVFLASSTIASAQLPSGNIFLEYSYARTDLNTGRAANLSGWNGGVEAKIFPFVQVVVDGSGYYGDARFPAACSAAGQNCSVDLSSSLQSLLVGPQVALPVGKWTVFAQALFGASRLRGTSAGVSESDTSFAQAFGGGIDYRLVHGIAWRLAGDELETHFFGNLQNNLRLSTGIVVRF